MKVTINRFEGPYAVCKKEDGNMVDIKRFNIPVGAKEGDILDIEDDASAISKKDIE